MRSRSAVLQLIDGRTLRVTVPDPAPPTFTIAAHPGPNRVLTLKDVAANAIYVESDRRKTDVPVAIERRRRMV